MTDNKREAYVGSLSTIQELILLGERYIPTGPSNAYDILDNISVYVNSLELKIVKMRAAITKMQRELEMQRAVEFRPEPKNVDVTPFVNQQKRDTNLKALMELQENAARMASVFPKVTL